MAGATGTVIEADYAAIGEIFQESIEDDLFLWNWGCYLAHFLKRQIVTSDPTVYVATDTGGNAVNMGGGTFMASSQASSYNGNVANWYNSLKACVGGGSVVPIITDYQLGQQWQEVMPTSPKLIASGNILKVLFSASFPFASETICSEVGLKMKGAYSTSPAQFFMTRDTFTAVTVPAGGSLTVQFELWFNGTPT
jgi:hypothetical protein